MAGKFCLILQALEAPATSASPGSSAQMTQKEGKTVFGPVEHPWFDALWRRIVLVAFCAGWTGVEYAFGNITWVYIMAAITAYAAWAYLFNYKGPDDPSRVTRSRMEDDEG